MVYNHYVIEDELFDTVNESSWTNYSTAKALCERVAKYVNDGSIWNAHFEDAIMYMRERDTATINAYTKDGKLMIMLTDEMDDEIYNHKLTVNLTVPESWQAVKITQGKDVSYAKVEVKDGVSYVLANVLPDGGEASVEPIALSEIPEEKPEEIKPTPDIGGPAVPPTATVPEVYTFDTLDGYLGGVILFDNSGYDSSKLLIVNDGENKVLKHEKPEGEFNPLITIRGNELSGASYYVMQTKFKLEHTSSGGELYLGLLSSSGTYAVRAYVNVNSDKTLKFTVYRSGSSSTAVASNIGKLGEWIELTLVYTVTDGTASITLYSNGTEVLSTPYHYLASSAPMSADQIKMFKMNFSYKFFGNLYLDDLALTPTNEAPVIGGHEHTYVNGKCSCGAEDPDYTADCEHTYTDGACTKCGAADPSYTPDTPTEPAYRYTYSFDTLDGIVFDNQSVDTNTVSIVTEGTEKLLKFEKPSGRENPSILLSAETASGATSMIVEMDMRVDMTSSSGEIYFSLANSGGFTYAYRSYIKFNSNGTVEFTDYSRGTDKVTNTKSGVDITKNKTFKLKIVYTTSADGTVTITAYVNNAEILSTDNYHDRDSQIISASSVEKLRINPSASFTGSIYIDNLTLKQIAD